VRCKWSWTLSRGLHEWGKLFCQSHQRSYETQNKKKLETKIKGFFQNQELNNSGFECILLVSTRVLNFATSNCCQLFHAHLDFTMSTLDTFSYPSRRVFFPPIFFYFTIVVNFCQENTFCIETCFFQIDVHFLLD
jgi:hypothetical protein